MEENTEEWKSFTDAAKYFEVGRWAITRMVQKHKLDTREDSVDDRVKLVNMRDLEKIFQKSPTYKKKKKNVD